MGQAQQFYVLKAAGECTLNGKPITLGSSITLSSAEKEDIIRVGEGLILREKSGSTLNFPTQGEYLVSDVLAEFIQLKLVAKNQREGEGERHFDERGYDWVSHIVGQPIKDNNLGMISQYDDRHGCGRCGPQVSFDFDWHPFIVYQLKDILISWDKLSNEEQYEYEITLINNFDLTETKFKTSNNYFYFNIDSTLCFQVDNNYDCYVGLKITLASDPSNEVGINNIVPYEFSNFARWKVNGEYKNPSKEQIDEQYQSYLALNNIEKITTSADKITEAFFFEHIGLYLDAQRSYFQAIALANTEAEKKIYEQIYKNFYEAIYRNVRYSVCRTAHSCSK